MDLIKNYLTQKSTYLGLFKVAAAFGLFTLAPEVQNEVADLSIKGFEGVLAFIGLFFIVKNERKDG
jgi:hypothetical protein